MTSRFSALTGSILAVGLIATAVLPFSEASAHAGLVAGCPKAGSAANQYIDVSKWRRGARKEVLHSLKTGTPVDWVKVYCGAIREIGRPEPKHKRKHHRRAARPVKVAPHRKSAIRHGASPDRRAHHTAPVVIAATPPSKKPPPLAPSKAPTAATSATPPAAHTSPSPAPAGRAQPTAFMPLGEASRPDAGDPRSVLLLIVVAASLVAFAGRRRLTPALAAIRPVTRLSSVRVVRPRPATVPREATASSSLDPFTVSGLALTGVGAASVARGIVVAMLTGWPTGLIEVVISRTDAWDLLGIDTGDLVEERIPGLVLTDDFLQAKTYLQTPGPRRLFISCSGGLDLLHDLLTRERGRIAAVSLSPWLHDTLEVMADGQITWMSEPHLANTVTHPLPTLTRPEAYAQLMSLPTVVRRRPSLVRRS